MISILMPVKNAARYLDACLNSILNQDYHNWELLAVDDGSTDQSAIILNAYKLKDNRIKVFKNSGQGIVDALKLAYVNSSGRLIHRMDADDLMPKDKLSILSDGLQPGQVSTGMVEYFSDDWMVGLGFQNYQNWINELMHTSEFWKDIYVECPIPSPAWMMHREDLDKIGAFDSAHLPEDYDLCFRMYQHGLIIKPRNKLVHRWRDSQNRTSRKDPTYYPMAYYPLKMNYFLELERNNKDLVLWGAGKKGKRIAKWLIAKGVQFYWLTNNQKKIGVQVHQQVLKRADPDFLKGKQTIIAVASPNDKQEIMQQLISKGLKNAQDYWWFC